MAYPVLPAEAGAEGAGVAVASAGRAGKPVDGALGDVAAEDASEHPQAASA